MQELFADFNLEVLDNAHGALPGLDNPALKELVELVDGNVAPKFGWTDVARFAALGIPAVNLGPGDPNLAHASDEHVSVDDLTRCQSVITKWLGN
jgi:succinyl-diaminopimelate desuccinylase